MATLNTTSDQATTPQRTDLALTLLRVATGVIFLAHGDQNLGISGLPGTTVAFTQLGGPLP